MSDADLALLVVVLLLLPLAASRNFTALGLLLAYFFVLIAGLASAEPIPLIAVWLCDMTVLAMIYMKPPAHDCYPYKGWLLMLRCVLWTERSWPDRVIIASFIAGVWPTYWLLTGAVYWWALYWLAVLQYLAASLEAFLSWRSAKASPVEADEPSSSASLRHSWGLAGGP